VARAGADAITAVDPSPPFVAAIRERFPGIAVEQASAEALPFPDSRFDVSLAQLVVHHMADAVGGVREMGRVTRSGGVVAACVWDLAGGRTPLSPFWKAVEEFDPEARDESDFPGTREGELAEILSSAGMVEIEGEAITFDVEHHTFEEWWDPFLLGVGPAGRYVADLAPQSQERLAALIQADLSPAPFTLSFRVWAARGLAPSTGQTM
jgi:SAM-dependent methyltransferase